MNKKSTEISLDGLINGDALQVKALYTLVFPKVESFIINNSGTREDAHEIFQEALFQIIVRAKTRGLTVEKNFKGYLFVCCRNIWFNAINKTKKTVRNDDVIGLKVDTDETLENILYQERWDLFEEKISKLSENCRNLLKSYFKKVSYEVIIQEFGYTSKNVAFQRIHKCKKKLTDLIQQDPKYKEL